MNIFISFRIDSLSVFSLSKPNTPISTHISIGFSYRRSSFFFSPFFFFYLTLSTFPSSFYYFKATKLPLFYTCRYFSEVFSVRLMVIDFFISYFFRVFSLFGHKGNLESSADFLEKKFSLRYVSNSSFAIFLS